MQIRGPHEALVDFHNALRRFQGGTKNCALCDTSGGVLPCSQVPGTDAKSFAWDTQWGRKSSTCKDNSIVTNNKNRGHNNDQTGVFYQHGKHGGGRCTGFRENMCLKASTFSTEKFPGLGAGTAVLTKCMVTHPHKASRRHGVVAFKRIVQHTCKGTGCKAGSTVSDVEKVYSNRLICS